MIKLDFDGVKIMVVAKFKVIENTKIFEPAVC